MYTQAEIDAYMQHLAVKGYKRADIDSYRDHLINTFGPKAPGGSPETAVPGSPLTMAQRVRMSFGDPEGNAAMLTAPEYAPGATLDNPAVKNPGFKDVTRTKDGQLAVKGQDGKWQVDAQNFLPSDYEHPYDSAHPLNYLAAHLGMALPAAGMVAGGAAAGVPGAMFGGYSLEGLRQEIGKRLGTYAGNPDAQLADAAREGLGSGMAELGGKALNALPVKKYLPGLFTDTTLGEALQTGAKDWANKAKSGVAAASSLISRVPVSASQRIIERPTEVLAMAENLRPGHPSDVVQGIAEQAQQELSDNLAKSGQTVGKANAEFMKKYGRTAADTSPILAKSDSFLNQIPVNEFGEGKLSAQEINTLKDWANKNFKTTIRTPEPYEGAEMSRPVFKTPQTTVSKDLGNIYDADFTGSHRYEKVPDLAGWDTDLPRKNFDQLKPTADALATDVGNYWNNNRLAKTLPTDLQYKENIYKSIKDQMHMKDPDYLGQADANYTGLKGDARLLRALEQPGRGEGFISNIMGRNKTEAQNAAARAIPDTFNGPVKDLQASRDFDQGGVTHGGWPTFGQTVRGALGAGAGAGAYYATHDPIQALAASMGVAAVTDPAVHKYGLAYGSRVTRPLVDVLQENAGQATPLSLKVFNPWQTDEGEQK